MRSRGPFIFVYTSKGVLRTPMSLAHGVLSDPRVFGLRGLPPSPPIRTIQPPNLLDETRLSVGPGRVWISPVGGRGASCRHGPLTATQWRVMPVPLPIFFPEAATVRLFGDQGLLMVDILHPDAWEAWDATVRSLNRRGYQVDTEPCGVNGRVEAYRLTKR